MDTSRAAHMLSVGGEELFGSTFINELISQVKPASLVNNSVAGTSATSTPAKHNHRRSPPTDTRDKNFSNNNRYVENSLFLAKFLPSRSFEGTENTTFLLGA